MDWRGHYHGYGPWIGSSDTYGREGSRRPAHEIVPEAGTDLHARYTTARAEFKNSAIPPMITAHWFLKAAEHHLPSRVWLDPEEAVIWLKGVYAENLPIEGPELTYVDLDSKIAHALEVLPLGQDVSWVYYLPGKRIVSYSVVCCPNRVHPEIPCPLPPA